ncbi:MAG: dCTP deaminase [Asgard group archaeon]|nr:dCTP deaminase [Asgard group archaeon]
MTVLSKEEILKHIEERRIEINPFESDHVGPTSIDLTLGNKFRVFKKVRKIFHVKEDLKYEEVTKVVSVKNGDFLLLMPGELVHGITKERIRLSEDLAGWIEGRSRFARIGLMIHVTAGLVQPCCDNKQVLEISNMSPMPIALYPGTRICQIILERIEGKAKYEGRFKDQISP